MSGFTFNGLHCERDMHLKYAPTEAERAGFFAKYNIQDAEYDCQDGGIFYGSTLKPQEMKLPCFYEEISITEREKIFTWLEHKQHGKLIFDERPFCYYEVVPGDGLDLKEYPVLTKDGMRYCGILTVTFVAYNPSAILMHKTAEAMTLRGLYKLCESTDVLPGEVMPADPTVDDDSFLVYNPGTRRCGQILRVAGNTGSESVVFHNEATGQSCKLMGQTNELTTNANKWIEVDGDTMQVFCKGEATSAIDYSYHDDGYISLAPAAPVLQDVWVSYAQGGIVTSKDSVFKKSMVGQYMWLGHNWRRILTVQSPTQVKVLSPEGDSVTGQATYIATLNHITITKGEGVKLTKLEIDYRPKVR